MNDDIIAGRKEGFGKPYILVAGNQRIELKLKAWKRSRMKLNWNVPCRGLGFDGNGTIESVYSQSSQYYVISAVGLNNYQYARALVLFTSVSPGI